MENTNTQENSSKFAKFEESFKRIQTFLMPVLIAVVFVFQFGYGMRDTQASTSQEIEELKKQQAATTNQISVYRNERLSQFDEFKKDVKNDFKGLREDIEKKDTISREDSKRLEEKLDRILEMRLSR